jgi:hypothetical protein
MPALMLSHGGLEAVYLVDVAAGHAQRGVVLADGLFVRPVEQAVHLAVVVVVELDLANPEPRTPSARVWRVSSAICAMASAGSFRSGWKSMNRGMRCSCYPLS